MPLNGFYLCEYDLIPVTVVKRNTKSIKVSIPAHKGCIAHEKNISFEKFIDDTTPFVVVWELWKGRNGRGGYRIDTTCYPNANRLGWRGTLDYVIEKEKLA